MLPSQSDEFESVMTVSAQDGENGIDLSVVIPAYNCASHVHASIESLKNQGILESKLEVIVVNNGSDDDTKTVLADIESRTSNVRVATIDKKGVSAARNTGMDLARGRYIAFLDADDYLDSMTLGPAVSFFDQHRNEIDLVVYPMLITEKARTKPHVREQILTHTGVYDLSQMENAFALITNINVVVKNGPSTPRFRENLQVHEDLCFMLEVLLRKERVGFSKSGAYRYIRSTSSVTYNRMAPEHHFEDTMGFWEDLFNRYQAEPPVYLQASYLNELNWKIKAGILFPRHYEGERFETGVARIWSLLQRVNPETIASAPRMDIYFQDYFLRNACVANQCVCGADGINISVFANGVEVVHQDEIELLLNKTIVLDDCLCLSGVFRSPLFNYRGKPSLTIRVDDEEATVVLKESPYGYNGTDVLISRDWEFYVEVDIATAKEMHFALWLDSARFPFRVATTDRCRFRVDEGLVEFRQGRHRVSLTSTAMGGFISFNQPKHSDSNSETGESVELTNQTGIGSRLRKRALRVLSKLYPKQRSIWLYCDSVEKVDGIAKRRLVLNQFIHDSRLGDGIDRYFVAVNDSSIETLLHAGIEKKRVIAAGSGMHKLLYTQADMMLIPEIEDSTWKPFTATGVSSIADYVNYRLCCISSNDSLVPALRKMKLTRSYIDVEISIIESEDDDNAQHEGVQFKVAKTAHSIATKLPSRADCNDNDYPDSAKSKGVASVPESGELCDFLYTVLSA